jgi:hypothetical protein
MARRAQDSFSSAFGDLNLLLLMAWEHGARHVALRGADQGTELSFLDPEGAEHQELLSMSYPHIVKGLRQMTARHGRIHLNMAGHQWDLQAIVPPSRCPERVFLHMHPAER